MSGTHYDAAVIGGGIAGLPLALKLGFKGFKVALIERDKLGGTCLNRGCIPSKTLIASAKVAKARALGEAEGLIKVVADVETDRLLGASVVLAEGAEVVHELVSAIKLGARYTDLEDMMHIHPTLAEGLSSALGGVHYEEGI